MHNSTVGLPEPLPDSARVSRFLLLNIYGKIIGFIAKHCNKLLRLQAFCNTDDSLFSLILIFIFLECK